MVRIFGVTATPNRGDRKGLREVFSNVSDQIRIGELIASGHLVKPRTFVIDVGVQDKLRQVSRTASDFDMGEVSAIMNKAPVTDQVVEKNFDTKQAHVFGLPATLDLHYVYLSGLDREEGKDGPGWPQYEPEGNFVTRIANDAAEKSIVPMFTLYQVAARGEQRFDLLVEDDFMTKYWAGARLLFTKLGAFGKPAFVHLEPDFWGF
jgi:hypothetical protein